MPAGGGLSWKSYNKETPTADDNDTLTTNIMGTEKRHHRFIKLSMVHDRVSTLHVLALFKFLYPVSSNNIFVTFSSINIASNEGFLKNEKDPYLTLMSAGHVLHVFVNGKLAGTINGALDNPKLTYSDNVKLRAGINKISLLSVFVGLSVCLVGESLSLHTLSGSSSVEWV
ncbi:hypothetical protein FXO38_35691 [Capsicum annuum]|nr:hypothetical protein FXO37_36329 [Capsicum annuum]KAF3614413.1 hypothetical protein FXO38_35691 [Capsicum annuum]